MDLPHVVCIMGPTASGKTDLAIEKVIKGGYEIISVDSAMIYRDMNIGTAKPTAEELEAAPHQLIDIRDPAETYSVGDFLRDAHVAIESILAKNKTPLLVGGTMMYFYQLQNGISDLPSSTAEIRQRVADKAQDVGWAALHEELQKIDPVAAQRINQNDPQRLSRALEVFYQTGQSLTHWQQQNKQQPPAYEFENVILAPERAIVHERIEKRFDKMLEQGFVEEVEALYAREDLTPEMPSIRCVGYRQAWDYLSGDIDKATFRDKAIIATRQLCKRQYTWLRQWRDKP